MGSIHFQVTAPALIPSRLPIHFTTTRQRASRNPQTPAVISNNSPLPSRPISTIAQVPTSTSGKRYVHCQIFQRSSLSVTGYILSHPLLERQRILVVPDSRHREFDSTIAYIPLETENCATLIMADGFKLVYLIYGVCHSTKTLSPLFIPLTTFSFRSKYSQQFIEEGKCPLNFPNTR